MANKFKQGEIVVMKSGGPPMTVDKAPGDQISSYGSATAEDYHCEWFKGATIQHGRFGEHLLEPYAVPKK